jgi:hypothetical protein
MEYNQKKFWYKRKKYGIGWDPASWQGWLTLIVWMTLLILIVIGLRTHVMAELAVYLGMIAILFVIVYKRGEKL